MKRIVTYLKFWTIRSIVLYVTLFGLNETTEASVVIKANDSLTSLIAEGQKKVVAKDYNTAIEVYNKALRIALNDNLSEDTSFIHKKIGGIYYAQKKYNKAKKNYRLSISQDHDSRNAADSHFNLALIFRKQKDQDSLLFHLHKSLSIYENIDDNEGKFSTFLKAGIVYRQLGYYDLSIKYLLLAYDGFDASGNVDKKASVCNSIAAAQRLQKNPEIAKQYYIEALNLRKELGDSLKLSYSYNNLANLLKDQKKYDSAIVCYNSAIRIQETLKETSKLGQYYYNLGTAYYLLDDYPNAERNYRVSLRFKKKKGDTLSLMNSYKELAMVAVEQNQYNLAKKYLDTTATMIDIRENSDAVLRYYEVQTGYHDAVGDFENALRYQKAYSKLYETLFQDKQAKVIQELQEQFESEKKLRKIQELTNGNIEQRGVISDQKLSIRKRDVLLLIAFGLILLSVVLYYLIRQRQKTKEQNLELHRLESIFKGQEIIKEKISKDLHDIVTTSFDGVRLKILAMPNAKNANDIGDSIVNDIGEINEQIRLISHRLSPLGNKIKNTLLTEIILDQLTEFQYYRKVFVDVQLPLPEEINHFILASQTNLYGIVLEALNNIEKHSQATEIRIRHQSQRNLIELTIVDNGIGFHNTDRNGIGILNMKQRAELLLGECKIENKDSGTIVTITFPIKSNTK